MSVESPSSVRVYAARSCSYFQATRLVSSVISRDEKVLCRIRAAVHLQTRWVILRLTNGHVPISSFSLLPIIQTNLLTLIKLIDCYQPDWP